MNRFLSATDLADAYRLPKHVRDQLFGEVAPVEKDDQGEPLYLEAHVDAWLNQRYAAIPGHRAGEGFLTIKEVAQQLRCSYSEARDRMLDGRIRTVKDGRWLRTRREWVEQYLAAKTIKPPDPEVVEIPRPRGRRHVNRGPRSRRAGWGISS
jgi:excisionase family DNA binding protein